MPYSDLFLARLVVPVVVTVIAAVAVGFALRRGNLVRVAAVGVPIGAIAGYAVLPGLPWTPPTLAADKLVWLALGGALAGLAIDIGARGRLAATIAALVWPAVGMAWLGGPELLNHEGSNLYRYGEVSLVLGLLLVQLGRLSTLGSQGPVTAAVIAAGLSCLALVSGSPGTAAVGLPLAAAGLGWVACNWPRPRFGFGAAGLLGGSGVALLMAGHAALLTPVNATLVLLVLSAVLIQPVVPAVAGRIPVVAGPAARPLVTAAVLAVPSLLAVLLAWLAPDLVPSLY